MDLLALAVLAGQFATKFASFRRRVIRAGDTLAGFQAVGQTNGPRALLRDAERKIGHMRKTKWRQVALDCYTKQSCRFAVKAGR